MALTEVDWAPFAGPEGGHRFERFCADLLAAQGYAVEHMAKGGNDEGKDLLILQRPKDAGGAAPGILCLVECKSRTSRERKALSLEDIHRSLWAIFENNCTCLVLFTTHKFNSQAVNCFLRVNERGRVRISWIDQDDLVEMGCRHPDVWRRHLGCEPPQLLRKSTPASDLRAYGQVRRIYWGDDEPLGVVVQNCGPDSGRAMLLRDGAVVDEIVLDHHQRSVLRAPPPNSFLANPYDGLTVKFDTGLESVPALGQPVEVSEHLECRRRVDHLFVDPDDRCGQILRSLAGSSTVHLRGTAGSGKSRLLAECRGRAATPLMVDLARSDEPEPLLQALVQQITGWPVPLLGQVPEPLVGGLSGLAECDRDQIKIIADYCAQRGTQTAAATAHALIALAPGHLKTLIVDNLQDASDVDEAILKEALSPGSGLECLLATRTTDSGLPEKSKRILAVSASVRLTDLSLDRDIARQLETFVREAAVDAETADFLSRLMDGESFQSWVSKLKALRQLGALNVDQEGRHALVERPRTQQLGGYARLQELILFSRLPEALRKPCGDAIQAASVFGKNFPVAFIESLFGLEGIEALDELERRELIKPVAEPSPYGLCFRFDHELTRRAVLGAIPTIRRTRVHEAAARFIEQWPDFQAGSGHYEAAAHYRSAGRVADALLRFEEGARHYLHAGRVANAQGGLMAALPLFDQLPIDRSMDNIAEELSLRELLLESALLVNLPDEQWERQIEAFQIQSHLFPGLPDTARRFGRGHCFVACFEGYRRRVPAAWREMQKALRLLEGRDDPLPLAEALKWGANLQKNLGAYDDAAAMAARAYELYLDHGDERRAGETATELSHVHYETYRFAEALSWGERALGHYGTIGHPSLVARARIDIARMRAVLFPEDPQTVDELEMSVRLSRHAGLGPNVAKALMNWGIYLELELGDARLAAQRYSDAEQELRGHPSDYLDVMLGFARDAVLLRPAHDEILRASQLGQRLVAWCSHFEAPEQIGDRRMQLMLKALGAAANPAVLAWIESYPDSTFVRYAGIGLGKKFAALEIANPLVRRGGLALYY